MSLKIDVNAASLEDIERVQRQMAGVLTAVSPSDGLKGVITLATLQMHRFVANNIEVDSGRTKNSIFPEVTNAGNSVVGVLGSNVSYSPFVRDANHGRQFFDYAKDVEGPNIKKLLGDEMTAEIERGFNQ